LPVVQLGLEDENPGVRFAALVTAGKLRMLSLKPMAQRRLDDKNASVRAAALFAVKASGGEVDLSPMAPMLASNDPGLRGNVAMLLGLLGDASAAPMLKEMAGVAMPRASDVRAAIVRVQVAEAVALLGDDEALDALRAAAYSPYPEVRILAVQAMGHVRDQRMAPAIIQMLEENPQELKLAAAEALGRMGLPDGKAVALQAAASPTATVRVQTAFALRRFDDPVTAAALVGLLNDPEPVVRLAAAAAVLQPMRP
jgi:HEAT repeat protein